jgi:tRNA U34 5-methylaminomethyl-2-thiouridine-forming methyltransferase MnmC
MEANERQIRQTADGSPTLYVPGLDEHYHSVHGAVQESMHVFIRAGLHASDKQPLHIFEMGYGTGLNAYLACTEADRLELDIRYHSLERYPLSEREYSLLDFSAALPGFRPEQFRKLHESAWGSEHDFSDRFRFRKDEGDIRKYQFRCRYDLVFWDAFAPDKQPGLWSREIFRNVAAAMTTGALLLTYSAKGDVKRALQEAGLMVEKRPGPPGKREMIRAWKKG